MEVERAPINRIQAEQRTNTARNTALGELGTKLSSLNTAAAALADTSLFSGRKAASTTSNSTWSSSATAGSATGSYKFTVTQLATTARREGAADIGSALNTTNDVSGLTLSNLRTGTAVTAGTFTVNGAQVSVALTASLQDVFSAISTATGGTVTASYSAATDKVTLSSAGAITLGAANDTSNFLQALKLANNATGTITSSGALGAVKTTAALASAGLKTAVTAVDGTGNGSFTLNGVSIAFNVNTDTLSGVLKRVNQSGAGVTASYDGVNDRVLLVNNVTGDIGISVSESAGGLLAALGLTGGATTVRGQNAQFTLNDGATLTSTSNTLDSTAHGVSGLSVTADSATTQTIQVTADTTTMRSKIDAFVTAYNAVQTFIDEKTGITTTKGKVSTSVLTNNREVQDWAGDLRSIAFETVSGLSGSVSRLDHLGMDFDSSTGLLKVADEAKLTAALRDKPADVEAFFQTGTTGFAAKFTTRLDALVVSAEDQQERLATTNTDLDRQIADMERRLAQQRDLLTGSFIKMEEAQARIQQQGTALTNAFLKPPSS